MGGIEQVIHQLALDCSQHGVKSDVLSLSRNGNDTTLVTPNYNLHRARLDFEIASTGFSIAAFRKFAELASHVDVVHYHFPWPFMDLVHFATRIDKPTVVTYHSDILRQKLLLKLYQPLKNRFLRQVDRIVATSPNYFATSDVLKRYTDKVRVIPIGLNKAAYPSPSQARLDKWKNRLGSRFFLFVGVLRYYKGLHILLQATQGLPYPIAIVGAGPIERELKTQAQRYSLHNVHFLGHIDEEDKVALLSTCYCMVFPSHLRTEAFGVALLEGAMYGKPMISSQIGTGTSFINIANETGVVVPPSDPLALREAMCYLWEHPELAATFGQHAEDRYWSHFTANRMASSYTELYKDLLKV